MGATFDKVFNFGDQLPLEAHGRGGTDFDSALQYISRYLGNHETEPDAVVIYTDGGAPAVSPEFQLPPEIPVIWCVTRDGSAEHLRNANYGNVIICGLTESREWKDQQENNS